MKYRKIIWRELFLRPPLKWFKDDITGMTKSRPLTDQEIFVNDTAKDCSEDRNGRELEWKESELKESFRKYEFPRKEDGSIESDGMANDKTNVDESNVTQEINISTDSESDYERDSCDRSIKSETLSESSSSKNTRTRKRELIDRILRGKQRRFNRIFDEPNKAVPLPRKNGTINVKFSERTFPTPARESHLLEEQEVRFISCFITISLAIGRPSMNFNDS